MRKTLNLRLIPFRKVLAGFLAIALTASSVLAPAAEANFWQDRREAKGRQNGSDAQTQMARLPADVLPAVGNPLQGLPGAAPTDQTVVTRHMRFGDDLRRLPSFLSSLPAAYGDIRDVALSSKKDAPLVVLIQDVHGVGSAQTNIAGMLNHFSEASPARLMIGMEGAAGSFEVSKYRGLKFPEAHRDVNEMLFERTLLTGAEFFALTAKNEPLLWGVEDADLYKKNLAAYRGSLAGMEAQRRALEALQDATAKLRAAHFTPALTALDDRLSGYHRGETGLVELINAFPELKSDAFPQINHFRQALSLEKSLDFKQVEKERAHLIQVMGDKLSKAELEDLVRVSVSYRAGELTHAAYYAHLKNLLSRQGLSLAGTPAFDKYVRYVLAADKIDPSRLFTELQSAQDAAARGLAATPQAHALFDARQDLRLADKILRHELTTDEWERYQARSPEIHNISRTISSLSGGTPAMAAMDLSVYEEFYDAAVRRNTVLADNLLSKAGSSMAVLIAGGFHTGGLAEELKKRGASTITLTPKLDKIEGRASDYLNVFSGRRTPLEKILLGEKLMLSATPELASTGLDGRAKIAARTHAILAPALAAARTALSDSMEAALDVLNAAAADIRRTFSLPVSFDRFAADGPDMFSVSSRINEEGRDTFTRMNIKMKPALNDAATQAMVDRASRESSDVQVLKGQEATVVMSSDQAPVIQSAAEQGAGLLDKTEEFLVAEDSRLGFMFMNSRGDVSIPGSVQPSRAQGPLNYLSWYGVEDKLRMKPALNPSFVAQRSRWMAGAAKISRWRVFLSLFRALSIPTIIAASFVQQACVNVAVDKNAPEERAIISFAEVSSKYSADDLKAPPLAPAFYTKSTNGEAGIKRTRVVNADGVPGVRMDIDAAASKGNVIFGLDFVENDKSRWDGDDVVVSKTILVENNTGAAIMGFLHLKGEAFQARTDDLVIPEGVNAITIRLDAKDLASDKAFSARDIQVIELDLTDLKDGDVSIYGATDAEVADVQFLGVTQDAPGELELFATGVAPGNGVETLKDPAVSGENPVRRVNMPKGSTMEFRWDSNREGDATIGVYNHGKGEEKIVVYAGNPTGDYSQVISLAPGWNQVTVKRADLPVLNGFTFLKVESVDGADVTIAGGASLDATIIRTDVVFLQTAASAPQDKLALFATRVAPGNGVEESTEPPAAAETNPVRRFNLPVAGNVTYAWDQNSGADVTVGLFNHGDAAEKISIYAGNPTGNFSQTVALAPGWNVITVKRADLPVVNGFTLLKIESADGADVTIAGGASLDATITRADVTFLQSSQDVPGTLALFATGVKPGNGVEESLQAPEAAGQNPVRRLNLPASGNVEFVWDTDNQSDATVGVYNHGNADEPMIIYAGNPTGNFSQTVVLAPGWNQVTVERSKLPVLNGFKNLKIESVNGADVTIAGGASMDATVTRSNVVFLQVLQSAPGELDLFASDVKPGNGVEASADAPESAGQNPVRRYNLPVSGNVEFAWAADKASDATVGVYNHGNADETIVIYAGNPTGNFSQTATLASGWNLVTVERSKLPVVNGFKSFKIESMSGADVTIAGGALVTVEPGGPAVTQGIPASLTSQQGTDVYMDIGSVMLGQGVSFANGKFTAVNGTAQHVTRWVQWSAPFGAPFQIGFAGVSSNVNSYVNFAAASQTADGTALYPFKTSPIGVAEVLGVVNTLTISPTALDTSGGAPAAVFALGVELVPGETAEFEILEQDGTDYATIPSSLLPPYKADIKKVWEVWAMSFFSLVATGFVGRLLLDLSPAVNGAVSLGAATLGLAAVLRLHELAHQVAQRGWTPLDFRVGGVSGWAALPKLLNPANDFVLNVPNTTGERSTVTRLASVAGTLLLPVVAATVSLFTDQALPWFGVAGLAIAALATAPSLSDDLGFSKAEKPGPDATPEVPTDNAVVSRLGIQTALPASLAQAGRIASNITDWKNRSMGLQQFGGTAPASPMALLEGGDFRLMQDSQVSSSAVESFIQANAVFLVEDLLVRQQEAQEAVDRGNVAASVVAEAIDKAIDALAPGFRESLKTNKVQQGNVQWLRQMRAEMAVMNDAQDSTVDLRRLEPGMVSVGFLYWIAANMSQNRPVLVVTSSPAVTQALKDLLATSDSPVLNELKASLASKTSSVTFVDMPSIEKKAAAQGKQDKLMTPDAAGVKNRLHLATLRDVVGGVWAKPAAPDARKVAHRIASLDPASLDTEGLGSFEQILLTISGMPLRILTDSIEMQQRLNALRDHIATYA